MTTVLITHSFIMHGFVPCWSASAFRLCVHLGHSATVSRLDLETDVHSIVTSHGTAH